MLCSRSTIQVRNYSDSPGRSSGSRLNLPGITTFARIPLGSDLFENSTFRNGRFTHIRMQPTALRILHIVEACRGLEWLRSDIRQLPLSAISADAFGSLSLTSGAGIG